MENKILNETEASRYIRMSLSYLRRDRCYGATQGREPGPAFIKIGKVVRYHIEDLDRWLSAHRKEWMMPR